jgi:membrane protein YdbS with pleckstrin-like domain
MSAPDPEPSDADWAASARPAEAFADEIVARRSLRPSRRVMRLLVVVPVTIGLLLALTFRAAAETVGLGAEAALVMGAAVLLSACVLTVAIVLAYRGEP